MTKGLFYIKLLPIKLKLTPSDSLVSMKNAWHSASHGASDRQLEGAGGEEAGRHQTRHEGATPL